MRRVIYRPLGRTGLRVSRLEKAGRPEQYQPYILFDPDVVRAIATQAFEVRAR